MVIGSFHDGELWVQKRLFQPQAERAVYADKPLSYRMKNGYSHTLRRSRMLCASRAASLLTEPEIFLAPSRAERAVASMEKEQLSQRRDRSGFSPGSFLIETNASNRPGYSDVIGV